MLRYIIDSVFGKVSKNFHLMTIDVQPHSIAFLVRLLPRWPSWQSHRGKVRWRIFTEHVISHQLLIEETKIGSLPAQGSWVYQTLWNEIQVRPVSRCFDIGPALLVRREKETSESRRCIKWVRYRKLAPWKNLQSHRKWKKSSSSNASFSIS